ncbi:MAG: diguanylate cyclase [Myxococcales bacterium FL481]|nr:MAG: diguanylate cyclase [Myxococcales bacterium FL481]
MSAAARALGRVRTGSGEFVGAATVVGLAALLVTGQLTLAAVWHGRMLTIAGLVVFTVVLCRALARQLSPSTVPDGPRSLAVWREFEFGLLLMMAGYALIAITGGPRSFLYPLIYALVSFLAVLHRSPVAAAGWLLAACGLEWLTVVSVNPVRYALFGYHVTFIGFFAAGNFLVLSGLARRLRGDHFAQLHGELARLRQDARDYRLVAAQRTRNDRAESRDEEEQSIARGSAEAVHEHVGATLELLRQTMRLQTCALLWRGESGTWALKAAASSSERVRELAEVSVGGLLAPVLRDGTPLRLHGLSRKARPPYYDGQPGVTDLCAVPVVEGEALRGVLCADRNDREAFTAVESATLQQAAQQVLRIVEHERALAAVERGKYEQERFYAASEALNGALTLDEVYDKTFAAMRTIASFDLAVCTSFSASDGRHRVVAVRLSESVADEPAWRTAAAKLDARGLDEAGTLVSIAIKNRHYMPAVSDRVSADACALATDVALPSTKSLLILPLVHGDAVLGTVTLVSAQPGRYCNRVRDMLRVISHHVAVNLQNARMYRAMEERATTDGLTGLTNHRAFQERFEQLHALAERTGQRFAVLLTDIDHFKRVNDTYGHPVGDMVLKRVAAVLANRARKVDVVARYGGEEFVLILPDTDGEGAAFHGNRLREEIAAQVLRSDQGSFHVTISMGVAEFPLDARDREGLIERADQALYRCKKQGRNRVIRWRDVAQAP